MRMKTNLGIRGIFFLLLFAAATIDVPAADDLSATLQKGLFEEQANRDLNAAIKHYEQILQAAEDHRKIVATAMYRLAESYRKQGHEARANELYARLIRDYSDQAEIMTELEGWKEKNRNIPELDPSEEAPVAPGSIFRLPEYLAEAAELSALEEALEKLSPDELRWALPTVRSDSALNVVLRNWRLAQMELKELEATKGADPSAVAALQSRVEALAQGIQNQSKEILEGVKLAAAAKRQVTEALLAQFQEGLQQLPEPARQREVNQQLTTLPRTRDRLFQSYENSRRNAEAANASRELHVGDRADLVFTLASDWEITGLMNTYRQAKTSLGVNHENSERWAAINAKISETEKLLGLKVEGVTTGLNIIAEAKKAALDVVEQQLNRAREESLKYAKPARGEVAGDAPEQRFAAWEQLLKNSPDLLNASVTNSMTYLQHAAFTGDIPLAEFLLEKGADLERKTSDGTTALHIAVERAHLRMAESLIQAGADINTRRASGFTPLYTAAQLGYTEIAEMLVKLGADVNARAVDRKGTWQGAAPLHAAAVRGHEGVIQLLARNGADLNAVDNDSGNTPLLYAIARKQVDAALALLKAGADPNERNLVTGIRTLHERPPGHPLNAHTNPAEGHTPLTLAVRSRLDEVTKALLNAEANPDATTDGWTPLHYAVAVQDADLVKLLLSSGANPDIQDGSGKAPLHYSTGASFPGDSSFHTAPSLEITSILLENKANPDLKDNDGYTPLHYSIGQEKAAFLEKLLLSGANPNTENKYGLTPLHYAAGAGYHPASGPFPEKRAVITELLLKHGAKVNAKDANGMTPLHYAHTPEIARILIQEGANVNFTTDKGFTPLDSSGEREAVAAIIREAGGTNGIPEQDVSSPGLRSVRTRVPLQ